MPRAAPVRTPPAEPAPRRVESSLLVVEGFTDQAGNEWRRGDRDPLARRAVREAAKAHPEWFVVEYETALLDPAAEWFVQVDAEYERRYQQAKAHHDGAEQRRKATLGAEYEEQEAGQPELEREYKQQEKRRREREEKAREEQVRRKLENDFAYADQRGGFHYHD